MRLPGRSPYADDRHGVFAVEPFQSRKRPLVRGQLGCRVALAEDADGGRSETLEVCPGEWGESTAQAQSREVTCHAPPERMNGGSSLLAHRVSSRSIVSQSSPATALTNPLICRRG